ncbi:Protein NRT1/ PTR FAMILY 2.7 [Morella rubra]|uniref:Protein NRT1/ PTR FAMILY 2.7 n=1 Tax=Morella rubra TaxID=262757 RepID=A0A6A1WQR2_9ROSI|nr:Protein NRT1/ PTR FAMILY 2.7 [Morella rubra]
MSKVQYAVLYIGLALASIGSGGWFTLATMGANQFDKPSTQAIFFNWYFFTLYASSAVSNTAIIYVEDNVSWGLGFGLSAVTNFIGLAFLLLGNRFYVHDKPQGSPFTGITCHLSYGRHLSQLGLLSLISTAISLTFIDRFLYVAEALVCSTPPTNRDRPKHSKHGRVSTSGVEDQDSKSPQPPRPSRFHSAHVGLTAVSTTSFVGVGEAFHFPGQVAQEFSLKSTNCDDFADYYRLFSTALISCSKGHQWLPDNLNDGRLDNVYRGGGETSVTTWCALVCSYQNVEREKMIGSGHNEQ